MLNISAQELLVVLVLALVVVGPQKLPELARSIGKGMREFRKMQSEVKDMVKVDLNPEPPTVHQPGVSGPAAQSRPHRTRRAAGQGDATERDAGPTAAEVASAPSPGTPVDDPATPPASDPDPDGPPAAAGAG